MLVNKPALVGAHTASPSRNLVLLTALGLSVWLTIEKLPDYLAMVGA